MSKPQRKTRYEKILASPNAAVPPKDALIAFGECIVMDAYDSSDSPPRLSAAVALEGANAVITGVSAATASAECIENAWDRVTTQSECDELTFGLLRVRMDAWYAIEAIDCLAETSLGDVKRRLIQSAEAIDEVTEAYDDVLVEHLDILSTLVATPWLRQWRQELPPRHEPLPWWLDGTLEAEAIRIGRESDREPRLALPRGGYSAVFKASDVVPVRRHSDDALRLAVAALAAAAPADAPMKTIAWTLPGSSLTATLYVPSRIAEGEQLSMHLGDGGDGSANQEVGSIVFLNGRPACWRLSRDVSGGFVTASWSWDDIRELSQSRELTLQDGQTGAEWSRTDSHSRA